MNAVIPKLIRVQDRLTLGRESAVWRINPRTGFLESRAGLSWTGIRKYRTPQGLLRVLRRPEQVNAPGHLRTLRRLPCCEGHPNGGRDVVASNFGELGVGWTGDAIAVEALKGYPRPVGDISVMRPSTIARMVPAEVWEQYLADFPEAAKLGIRHDGSPARTGTSLGYNALWYGPYVESEIVSERDDGALVGEWQGPNGPEQYDIEHIVDPECDVVQRLARNTGFNPDLLGGNHEAVALAALGGRGAEQSELMRIVDSADLPIDPDLSRRLTRVALQVPLMTTQTRDAKWTVGASRDLPIVSGEWDGSRAEASIWEWAGFDGDDPDPSKARQAFLIYDADAPELKGSYKLPIAEYRDGGLRVVDSGLRAAASYLPQTDAPQDVLDRARDVLDHYFAKLKEQQGAARDALRPKEPTIMQKIDIGFGRDTLKHLTALGLKPPTSVALTVDEVSAEMLRSKLSEMESVFGDLMEMATEAKSEAKEMEDKYDGAVKEMSDMMSVAEATKKVDEIKAALAEAEKMLAESKAAEESAAAERDKMKEARDALEAELAPHREAQLQTFRDEVVAAGFDKAAVAECKDAASIRRLVAATKIGDRYGKTRDDGSHVLGDDLVAAAFDGWWATKPQAAAPAQPQPSPTFANFPRVQTQRDNNDTPTKPAPVKTSEAVRAGMGCL